MAKSPATPAPETGPAPTPGAALPMPGTMPATGPGTMPAAGDPTAMGAPTAPPMPATGPGTMPAAGDPNAMGAPTAPPMPGAPMPGTMPASGDPAPMGATYTPPLTLNMPTPGDPAPMGAPTAPPMPGNMPAQGDNSAMGAAAPPPAMDMFTEKPFDMAAELSKSAEVESFQAATPVASAAPAASPPVEVEAHEPAPAAPGESAGYVAPPTLAPEPPVG